MAVEQVDYSQIYDFLYRIDRRIGALEKDALFIEKQVNSLDGERLKEFQTLTDELKNIRAQISLTKNNLGRCVHQMSELGKELKDSVKREDIDSLNTQLDEIKFEEYVMKNDLIRGV